MKEQSGTTAAGCPISAFAEKFDAFGDEFRLDPAEALRWAREQEPIFYNPRLGYWVVSRFADVKAVFRDNILFSPSIVLEKITPSPHAGIGNAFSALEPHNEYNAIFPTTAKRTKLP